VCAILIGVLAVSNVWLYIQMTDLKNLNKSEIIVNEKPVNQGANQETLVAEVRPGYAGYFEIVMTSTTSNAYVRVSYWYSQQFDFRTTLGVSGRVIVPILPTDGWGVVRVSAGNTNLLNGATETVTITYHY